MPNRSWITNLRFGNVLCVPELKCNLQSTSKATDNNHVVLLLHQYAKIIEQNGSTLVQSVRHTDL